MCCTQGLLVHVHAEPPADLRGGRAVPRPGPDHRDPHGRARHRGHGHLLQAGRGDCGHGHQGDNVVSLEALPPAVLQRSGISELVPGMKMDTCLFDPCGYSMNAIAKQVTEGRY